MKFYYISPHLHIEQDKFTHVALDDAQIEELHNFIHKIQNEV